MKYEITIRQLEHETTEDWAKEFVKTFYVYNLKEGTPAGAEKQAVAFIHSLLATEREKAKEEGRQEERERVIEIAKKKAILKSVHPGAYDAEIIHLDDLLTALTPTK